MNLHRKTWASGLLLRPFEEHSAANAKAIEVRVYRQFGFAARCHDARAVDARSTAWLVRALCLLLRCFVSTSPL